MEETLTFELVVEGVVVVGEEVAVMVVEVVTVVVVADPKEDLVHRSLVEGAFQEDNLDNQNLAGETCVVEEDEIH